MAEDLIAAILHKYPRAGFKVDLLECNSIALITLNRPEKLNAFTLDAFIAFADILSAINFNTICNSIRVVILTGSGRFFTAGNDLFNMAPLGNPKLSEDEKDLHNKKICERVKVFFDSLISFKKILIVAVNGDAVGAGVTMLPLADFTFAVPRATFQTPFLNLAIVAEGCSTVTFPRIMGIQKANELLLFGKKITSSEAKSDYQLVTEVFSPKNPSISDSELQQQFLEYVIQFAKQMSSIPSKVLETNKELLRSGFIPKELLLKTNEKETYHLYESGKEKEAKEAVLRFLKKSKM